jgi:carbonic anhydrase
MIPATLLALILAVPTVAFADAVTQTKETQAAMTPAEALQMLKDGHERFVKGEMLERDLHAQVKATAKGQYPFGVVLSCVDSRVPVEMVFDQGIGDLFVGRVAGNYVETDLLGSMEFATAAAGSKLIVVLGHSACGAVKGAIDHVQLSNLTHTLSNIAPAMYMVEGFEGERTSANKEFVDAVVEANVRRNVQMVHDRSAVMQGLVEEGKLMVVGGVYDLETGTIEWLDDAHASR